MTLEELRQTSAFLDLTPRQKTLVEEFLTHGDREKATRTAYPGKTPYQTVFSKAGVRRVLALAAGENFGEKSALDIFKQDVQKLLRSSKTTPSQIAAAKLYATLNGFIADSNPDSQPDGKLVGEKISEMNGRCLKTVVYDISEEQS